MRAQAGMHANSEARKQMVGGGCACSKRMRVSSKRVSTQQRVTLCQQRVTLQESCRMCRMRCAMCSVLCASASRDWDACRPLLHHHDLAPATCHGWTQDTQTSEAILSCRSARRAITQKTCNTSMTRHTLATRAARATRAAHTWHTWRTCNTCPHLPHMPSCACDRCGWGTPQNGYARRVGESWPCRRTSKRPSASTWSSSIPPVPAPSLSHFLLTRHTCLLLAQAHVCTWCVDTCGRVFILLSLPHVCDSRRACVCGHAQHDPSACTSWLPPQGCVPVLPVRVRGRTRDKQRLDPVNSFDWPSLCEGLLTLLAGCCVSFQPVAVCDSCVAVAVLQHVLQYALQYGLEWNGLDWSLGGDWSLDFYVTVSSIMSSRSLVLRVCPLAPWCSGSACCACAWWCLLLHEPMCMRLVLMCMVSMCSMCMRAVRMCMRPCLCKHAGTVSSPPPPLPTFPAPSPSSLNKTDSGKSRHATLERQCGDAGCRRPPYCL